ncbi:Na(+)-translocating NADH-quinone reductase subunit A [Motiliproteus coralliicola]|uniref:Na(+)-translocating NADH-quinone reductase subunit A n=1 Tax=Motiliproteus coralliicola TaxID=2283196 RepID=A0A369WUY8_9GAMM|nr:Na(+)-translocating NADH-quinone reductase subunit A [Motiliproteus coralliicola]RDE24943.1 Na(+)-translocating NADH-quinone reductase subunit A [Motiliproteus coralliicola]
MIRITKGLDLPIAGAPRQAIEDGAQVSSVAVLGSDYVGMKPTMSVRVGDQVKLGQVIFSDKKTPGVKYTAPASGVVSAINRGEKRALQSVVIDVQGDEAVEFAKYDAAQVTREQVVENLVESGLWTALRTRPYSKVPAPESTPNSIFITAIDTNPLSADPAVVVAEQKEAFLAGQQILSKLVQGKLFLCKAEGADIPAAAESTVQEFSGKHPAGNAGTHIHFLDPVSEKKTVWSIGYQDVIAVGKLFETGKLWTERVVALGGPQVPQPILLRTRVGANTDELVASRVKDADNRVISGSIFNGRTAEGPFAFLGRYSTQVSVLLEGRSRDFMGWVAPGAEKHSMLNIVTGKFKANKLFNFTTTTNGSERAMVPVGQFEELMPMDILPTQLLRALVVGDMDSAIALGALELDEEDLALCTYACAGKYEYGPILRDNLTRIEKEG